MKSIKMNKLLSSENRPGAAPNEEPVEGDRRARDNGLLQVLFPRKRGRKLKEKNPLASEAALLQKEKRQMEYKLKQANLIIVCGSPGAGKSTYGKTLATRLNAVFLDIDSATERLVRLSLHLSDHDPDDRDSAFFKENYRQPIYDQLFDIARDNIAQLDVVIAGPFTKEIRDGEWPKTLERLFGCHVEIHYVYCSPEIRKKRMMMRADPRDAAKFKNWHEFNAYYGNEDPPVFDHIRVDNSA